MGFFSNLFSSSTPDYPPLDDASTAAKRVAEVAGELKKLVHDVNDPLEIVPAEHAAYVFIGKPPKRFGLAWIHDGKVSGLNTLVKEHGVDAAAIERLIDALRKAYERHQDESHFTTRIEDRTVVVTPSRELEEEVHEIIDKVVH